MTTPTPESVKALADGLTKAQRDMLASLPTHYYNADGRTRTALERRGLAIRGGTIPNPHMPAWPWPALSATQYGRAVATHLGASHE